MMRSWKMLGIPRRATQPGIIARLKAFVPFDNMDPHDRLKLTWVEQLIGEVCDGLQAHAAEPTWF